ncbi:MAG: SEC-C domain-containing protein [Gemmataceae bacterium]|nr:SEC-C domain-containing protein [Gemmataceae bacterium]
MTERSFTGERLPNVDGMREAGVPMELRCGHCHRAAEYPVGRLFIDPDRLAANALEALDEAFGVSGYFHCRSCGEGGPWHLTPSSKLLLTTLLVEARAYPERARIHLAKLVLFDGTLSRWATHGEAHLKRLIEKEPDDWFLWNRLGNLYKAADAPELALGAFAEALKRNGHDVEGMHSVAQIHQSLGQDEKAAEWFHRFLLNAKHASDDTARTILRDLVRHALEELFDLHLKSDKRIPVFPPITPRADEGRKEVVVHLQEFDLSKQESWDRLIDAWVGDRAPRARPAPAPWRPSLPAASSPDRPLVSPRLRVGRNDPCPCGSGRKYKTCCMNR